MIEDFETKTDYLIETKGLLKDRINSLGGSITSGTTFRDYLVWLDSLYEALEEKTITGLPDSLEGKCEQTGTPTPTSPQPINITTGRQVVRVCEKNLFDKDTTNYVKGYYLNNNGVETSGTNWGVYYIPVKSNTAYSISGCTTNTGTYFWWFDSNKQPISMIGSKKNYTNITSPNNASYIGLSIVWNTTSSAYDGTTFMLEVGTTATTYEEYKGNDYEINLGKNLWGGFTFNRTINGIDFVANENGTITANGTATGQAVNISVQNISANSWYKTLEAGTYVLSVEIDGTYTDGSSSTRVQLLNMSGTILTYATPTQNGTLTITQPTQIWVRASIYSGGTAQNITFKPQLEKGSVATNFSPYKTPIYLGKIGDYQDYIFRNTTENPLYDSNLEEGQWYIHKEIGRVVLNGSQGTFSMPSTNRFNIDGLMEYQKALNTKYYLSNYYDAYNQTYTNGDFNNLVSNVDYGFDLSSGGSYTIRIKDTRYTSINDFKTWLSTHNVEVYYVLNTPTNTLIEDEELINQLNEIEIFTVISEDFYN